MSKYGNRITELDGIRFDSRREATRWAELRLLEKAGEIYELHRQVPFVLIPAQRNLQGNVIERAVKYIADFVYYDSDGNVVVEDAKGVKTDAYKLKKKMMLYFKGIEIKEV